MADDPPAGVPEWVVTYGDMMSLLLTFFIMLVSLGELKGDKKYQAMVESIMKRLGYIAGPLAPTGDSLPLNSLRAGLTKLGSKAKDAPDKGNGGVRVQGTSGQDLRVYRSRDGVCLNVGEPLPFERGIATLSPAATKQVMMIARRLAGKPNKIEVRGHSSPEPLPSSSQFVDAMSLSFERARNVELLLTEAGIDAERIRVCAAGDTEPPPANADVLSQNADRVEVFALDAFARDFSESRAPVR